MKHVEKTTVYGGLGGAVVSRRGRSTVSNYY